MLLPHVGRPHLYPTEKFRDYAAPDLKEENHWAQFVQACQGQEQTSAPFAYAGPLTESVLLGGVASHFPQTTLQWSADKLKFDLAEASQLVRRDYRTGWSIKGLT